MANILLLHQDEILHYRVALYNYLAEFFSGKGFVLKVVAEGVEATNPHPIKFDYDRINMGVINTLRYIAASRPKCVILFVNLKKPYLFPVIALCKVLGIRLVYWGHGRDLEDPSSSLKNSLYSLEHYLVDRIVLYAPHLREQIKPALRWKVSIANNTLATQPRYFSDEELREVKEKYALKESLQIIFVGRIQTRKRLDDLVAAFRRIHDIDAGLIIVGPDPENLTSSLDGRGIRFLGPLYGEEVYKLLQFADIYCIPGHVGLGIVDAFQYGLPIVTENVRHAPEIMYFREGENGFMVPRGDIKTLGQKLELLLQDGKLRQSMSDAAVRTIREDGSVEQMAKGFLNALGSLAL